MVHARHLLIPLVLLAGALLLSACGQDEIAALPEVGLGKVGGIQQNLSTALVSEQGFTLCYSDTFANTGTPMSTILAGCPGNLLMLACRPVGGAELTLASYAPRSVATANTGAANNDVSTDFYGVSWYYSDSWSWGFYVTGDGVNKSSCDTDGGAYPDKRMCWHTSGTAISDGYRCGTNFLNGNNTWERLIYSRS